MAFVSRVFSIGPRITVHGQALEAVTSLRLRIATLGIAARRVELMPHARVIRVSDRSFWFFTRARSIPFDRITAVIYGYSDMTVNVLAWARNTMDLFRVGLRLQDGRDVHLFHFLGDGPMENEGPLPDWLYFEQFLLDTIGTQETESRALAEMLSGVIGVEIVQR